jgi:hypothetical protein
MQDCVVVDVREIVDWLWFCGPEQREWKTKKMSVECREFVECGASRAKSHELNLYPYVLVL